MLHDGQNHDTPSPCSLNIIPLHFGQGLISSLNFYHRRIFYETLVVTVAPVSFGINVCSAWATLCSFISRRTGYA